MTRPSLHRTVAAVAVVLAAACGARMKAVAAPTRVAAADPSATAGPTATQIPEQLVVEGWMSIEVAEVGDVIEALRAQVEGAGGRVIAEEVSGGATSWSAHVKLRLPPEQVDAIAAWLAGRGQVLDKRITATDVSRTLFDQELALANLRATLDRLTRLLDQGGLTMADILAVEKEMTRLRGEIEAIEGEQRFLRDRVALATLDVALSRRDGAVTVARAKAYPGGRLAALVLWDPGERQRVRLGGGIVLHTVLRSMSIELDVFQEADDGGRRANAVLATLGGAGYSDFLGRGRRRFGNPYLGARLGYGYLDGSRFVLQGEAGLELFKSRHALVDVNLRLTGLIDDDPDVALVAGAGAVFAF